MQYVGAQCFYRDKAEQRTKNERNGIMSRKPWARADWKKKRKEIITPDSVCSQCGSKKGLVVHHPPRKYSTQDYVSLKGTVILCSKCHFLYHKKGLDLCPTCKKNYKPIRYRECYECHKKRESILNDITDDIAEEDEKADEWVEEFYAASPEKQSLMIRQEWGKIKKSEMEINFTE